LQQLRQAFRKKLPLKIRIAGTPESWNSRTMKPDSPNADTPPRPPRSCPPSALSPRAGFTLVEILIVIGIISLLTGVVVLNLTQHVGKGSQAAAKAQIQVLSSAVQTYYAYHRQYPTQQQGLQALVQKPTLPPIPSDYPEHGYLSSRTLPLDPWGQPYLYLTPGRQKEPFEIFSYGPDREPGGNDDVSSADLR
jgi:general secretion pathway protein G